MAASVSERVNLLFSDEKLFTRDNILAVCEGVMKADFPLRMPNFHAIQYYTEIPEPFIISEVLDFGLTIRTSVPKLDLQSEEFVDIVESSLDRSFDDTAASVADFILEMRQDNPALNSR